MRRSYLRLALAALLFACWIGWLIYLVANSRNPVILSRPQFLVAKLWLIADLTGNPEPSREVTVREVIWPAEQKKLAGTKIEVLDLHEPGVEGWAGAGEYILALSSAAHAKGEEVFRLTPLPPSPGFSEASVRRIYPATTPAREQLQLLAQEWHK